MTSSSESQHGRPPSLPMPRWLTLLLALVMMLSIYGCFVLVDGWLTAQGVRTCDPETMGPDRGTQDCGTGEQWWANPLGALLSILLWLAIAVPVIYVARRVARVVGARRSR